MLFDDYVMRQIRKIAELVAALAGKDRGLTHENVDEELADAYRALLGVDEPMVDRMSAASLGRLLADPVAVQALVMLLKAHGDVLVERGSVSAAQRRWHKALELATDETERNELATRLTRSDP